MGMEAIVIRVPIRLPAEMGALTRMAESEGRYPYELLRSLFLREARERGLLADDTAKNETGPKGAVCEGA